MKELQKALLREISTQMPRYGFDRRIVGQSFHRREPFGLSSLHLSFIAHGTDFDITADVALRIDAVEDLLNRENNLLSEKEKKHTFTIGAELGNIAEGRQRRWTISNAHHVPLVAAGVLKMFEEHGVPYLQRMSNFEALLFILSNHDKEAWLASPIHERRCKTIVALAMVMGKSHLVESFASQCDSFLREHDDLGVLPFDEFVKRLHPTS